MEWYGSHTMFVLLLPTVLVCIATAALIVTRKAAEKRKPPGPRGMPFIGHLHLLGKLPHQSLYQLSKVHGPLMSLRFGSVPVVVASNPEMARQVLQTHDLAFANRMPTAAANHIFGGCMDIAFSPPNAHWKLMRRLCATELFSSKGFHFFERVRAEEIRALMRSVLAESCVDVDDRSGDATPQGVRPKLQEATNNMITRMMLGKRFRELGELRQEGTSNKASIVELLGEMNEVLGMFNVGDFLPWLAWMDLQGCQRRSRRVAADLRTAFKGVVHARRLLETGITTHPPADYLDVLLQEASTTSPMEVLLDLFVGGTQTSSMTIEWALAELLSNPEKMRMLQAEIDQVVGRARIIEEADIQYLPYLVACVKETMRLHPVLPLLVPHKTNQACEISNFYIPANTQAYVNVWAIGRDPTVWENPSKFSPERFLETTTNSVDVQGQHFELLPFGSGRRICPGWRLGLLTVQSILGSLLQGFEWRVSTCEHLDMSESFHLDLSLATPLLTYTSPRLPNELY